MCYLEVIWIVGDFGFVMGLGYIATYGPARAGTVKSSTRSRTHALALSCVARASVPTRTRRVYLPRSVKCVRGCTGYSVFCCVGTHLIPTRRGCDARTTYLALTHPRPP